MQNILRKLTDQFYRYSKIFCLEVFEKDDIDQREENLQEILRCIKASKLKQQKLKKTLTFDVDKIEAIEKHYKNIFILSGFLYQLLLYFEDISMHLKNILGESFCCGDVNITYHKIQTKTLEIQEIEDVCIGFISQMYEYDLLLKTYVFNEQDNIKHKILLNDLLESIQELDNILDKLAEKKSVENNDIKELYILLQKIENDIQFLYEISSLVSRKYPWISPYRFDSERNNKVIFCKYKFKQDGACDELVLAQDYVIMKSRDNSVCFLNKHCEPIFCLSLDIYISNIFANGHTVVVYGFDNAYFFIIDTATKQIQEIKIPDNFDHASLQSFCYWKYNNLIIRTSDYNYLCIDLCKRELNNITVDEIACFAPELFIYISQENKFKDNVQIKSFNAQEGWFTYRDTERNLVGFVDSKGEITAYYDDTELYTIYNDHIDGLYFDKGRFVVIRCYTVETVLVNGTKEIVMTREDSSYEFRNSVYDASSNVIYIMSRYRKKSEQCMTLYAIKPF